MMSHLYRIDDLDYDRTHIGYFVHTYGVDRLGNHVIMVVNYDSSASGCNPYHWSPSPYYRYGHEFKSEEEARAQAKYAAGSWDVKSVDNSAIQVTAIEFRNTRTVRAL